MITVTAQTSSEEEVGAGWVGDDGRGPAPLADDVHGAPEQSAGDAGDAGAEPGELARPRTEGHVTRQRRRRDQPAGEREQPQDAGEPLGLDDAVGVELLGEELLQI